MSDNPFINHIQSLKREIAKRDAEIARLRARVEMLEKVSAAAQVLINEDADCDDPAEDAWWDWEKKFDALRIALKEVKL